MNSEDFIGSDCDFSDLRLWDYEYAVDHQSHLVGTTNNSAAGSGTMQPTSSEPRDSNDGCKVEINSATQVGTSVNVAGEASRNERKRKIDQAYRQRCKKNKKKIEEELIALRKQNASLQKKMEKFESKPDVDRQNSVRRSLLKLWFEKKW